MCDVASQGHSNLHGERISTQLATFSMGWKQRGEHTLWLPLRTIEDLEIPSQRRHSMCFQFYSLWHQIKHHCFCCWHFTLSARGPWKLESIKTIKQSSVQFIDDGIWQTHHTTQTEMETVIFSFQPQREAALLCTSSEPGVPYMPCPHCVPKTSPLTHDFTRGETNQSNMTLQSTLDHFC